MTFIIISIFIFKAISDMFQAEINQNCFENENENENEGHLVYWRHVMSIFSIVRIIPKSRNIHHCLCPKSTDADIDIDIDNDYVFHSNDSVSQKYHRTGQSRRMAGK